jgi:SAM-dependent methyltransferase
MMSSDRTMHDFPVDTRGDLVQDRITEFWSRIASDYDTHAGNMPSSGAEYRAWVEAMKDFLPRTASDVLDIGTGTGFMAVMAALLKHRVVGVDLSDVMLAEARTKAEAQRLSVRFERRDGVDPGFADASFDVIVSRHFIWTLREPLVAFRNWRTLLRPNGYVVAIDGHWFRDEQPSTDAGEPDLFQRHYTADTREALPLMMATDPERAIALFRDAGFADVRLSYLSEVHAVADAPPSHDPWYVVLAHA